jgi:hypothetical protein
VETGENNKKNAGFTLSSITGQLQHAVKNAHLELGNSSYVD